MNNRESITHRTDPAALYPHWVKQDPAAAHMAALDALDLSSGQWARMYDRDLMRLMGTTPSEAWMIALAMHAWLAPSRVALS